MKILALKEEAILETEKVFIKRTETGELRSIKGTLTLYESKGHLAVIEGKAMITANGYYYLNKIAGLSVITPPTLKIEGDREVPNPFPIIDSISGRISKVWCKKNVVGYGPTGNVVVTSNTFSYDIQMYFIKDLVSKVQMSSKAGRICLESQVTEEERKIGAFYKIEGDLGVYVIFSDINVLKAIKTMTENKVFAERKAQTICERNALKRHPAFANIYVDTKGIENNRVAEVTVIGYCHSFDARKLNEISELADSGREIVVEGEKVQVIEATSSSEEEIKQEYEATHDEEVY
jgi:hypothetical protein